MSIAPTDETLYNMLLVQEEEAATLLNECELAKIALMKCNSIDSLALCMENNADIEWKDVLDQSCDTITQAIRIVKRKITGCKRSIKEINVEVASHTRKMLTNGWKYLDDQVDPFNFQTTFKSQPVKLSLEKTNVLEVYSDDPDFDSDDFKDKQVEVYNSSNAYTKPVFVRFAKDGYDIPSVDDLKDYQKQAIKMILETVGQNEDGVLIAHTMGSGKTLTALTALQGLNNQNANMKALVTAPKSLTATWVEEYHKWARFLAIRMLPVLKNYDLIILKEWQDTGGILVVHHELFVKLTTLSPDVLVVDEAHKVQKVKTQLYQRINSIETNRRIFLTGTPLANNLLQYHTMLDLLCKDSRFGDRETFRREFQKPIRAGLLKDATDAERLEAKKKIQVFLHMGENIIHRVSDERNTYALPRISEFKCLYTAPGVPKMKENKEGAILIRSKTNEVALEPKFRNAIKLIESIRMNATDDSIIVFSSTIEILRKVASKFNALLVTGKTNDKESIISSFKRKDNMILCITKQIGNCGLNLQVANRVLLLDPDWNPAIDTQAVARVYRNGQTKEVVVYRFVVEKSVEEYTYRVAANKTLSSMHVVDDKSMKRVFDAKDMTYGIDVQEEICLSLSDIEDKSLQICFDSFASIHNYASTFKEKNSEKLDEHHIQEAINDYNKLCAESPSRSVKVSSGEIRTIMTPWIHDDDDDTFLVKPLAPYWRHKKGKISIQFASVAKFIEIEIYNVEKNKTKMKQLETNKLNRSSTGHVMYGASHSKDARVQYRYRNMKTGTNALDDSDWSDFSAVLKFFETMQEIDGFSSWSRGYTCGKISIGFNTSAEAALIFPMLPDSASITYDHKENKFYVTRDRIIRGAHEAFQKNLSCVHKNFYVEESKLKALYQVQGPCVWFPCCTVKTEYKEPCFKCFRLVNYASKFGDFTFCRDCREETKHAEEFWTCFACEKMGRTAIVHRSCVEEQLDMKHREYNNHVEGDSLHYMCPMHNKMQAVYHGMDDTFSCSYPEDFVICGECEGAREPNVLGCQKYCCGGVSVLDVQRVGFGLKKS